MAKEKIKLRDYQIKIVEEALEIRKKYFDNNTLIQAPTGSGKTIIAIALMKNELENGGSVIFLAHRRELIFQCSDKLTSYGIDNGIIMGKETRSLMPNIQVASIQTLSRRMTNKRIEPPRATLIIIDEAHHAVAKTYRQIMDYYPDAWIVGLTATPIRGDGNGLGAPFTPRLKADMNSDDPDYIKKVS